MPKLATPKKENVVKKPPFKSLVLTTIIYLVGGFNPFEKWMISPNRGGNQKIFETTT